MDTTKTPASRHMFIFSEVVMATPFQDNFKMPSLAPYDGKGDLVAHMRVFHT